MIYLVILLILLFGSINYNFLNKKDGRAFWLAIEWILLVLTMAFRYKVGGDTLDYMVDYKTYPTMDQLNRFNFNFADHKPLWYFFCAICKSINDSFFFFQFVHSLVINTIIIWFLKTHTRWYFTAILFYAIFFYLNFNTEILRASLSVCMFLLGFNFLIEQKWVKYLLFCVLGYGFHGEGLVMLFLPLCILLSKVKVNVFTLAALVGISLAFLFIFSFIPYLDAIEFLAYSDMERLVRHGGRFGISISEMGVFAKCIFIAPWFIILYVHRNQKNFILKGFLIIYIFMSIQSVKYHVLTARTLDFIKPLLVLSIAETLWMFYGSSKFHLNKILGEFLIVLSLFVGFYQYFEGSWFPYWKRYYPYSSLLNPKENPERERLMFMYKTQHHDER